MQTIIVKEKDILDNPEQVIEILLSGGVVILPTDTVYGLCAHPEKLNAVDSLFALKGRDRMKAIPLLASDKRHALRAASEVSPEAHKLMDAFWPGPLTVAVLANRNVVPELVLSGGDMVGLRIPDRESTRAIIRAAGGLLAVTSANPSGAIESIHFEIARRHFDRLVACIVDGGECAGGIPSTVVSCTDKNVSILREGGVGLLSIAEALNKET